MKKTVALVLLLFCTTLVCSQGNFVLQDIKGSKKIKFKLIHNLIIIPVEINGAELTFILDSGVRKPILFNILNTDSLTIHQTETILLRGLGDGEPVEAIKSHNNIFKVGNALNINQTLYAIFYDNLNFTTRLGIPIHGIIGYDLFKDLIVEINYSSKYIRLYNPLTYTYKTCKKCETLDLEFNNNKPYFNVHIDINNQKKIPVKLLIDSGGSDALWLFEDGVKNIKLERKFFRSFLGYGLSGSVYGRRSKIKQIYINNFKIKNINVAFPDEKSIVNIRQFKERNGSFSGELLKRFNVVFDYPNSKITLKKSRYFSDSFNYNKSGIELGQTGIRLINEKVSTAKFNNDNSQSNNKIIFNERTQLKIKPAYSIVELRKNSPAQRIGLKLGDVLLYVNNKPTYKYNLQEIIKVFYGEVNKKIRLKIERNGVPLTFEFRLESPMK